jgi:hypothetical protein
MSWKYPVPNGKKNRNKGSKKLPERMEERSTHSMRRVHRHEIAQVTVITRVRLLLRLSTDLPGELSDGLIIDVLKHLLEPVHALRWLIARGRSQQYSAIAIARTRVVRRDCQASVTARKKPGCQVCPGSRNII